MQNTTEKKWILEKYSKWINNRWKMMNDDPKKEMSILIIVNTILIHL